MRSRAFRVLSLAAMLTASASALGRPAVDLKPSAAPPNLVFIMSDDHAWQAVSAYGRPDGTRVNQTPQIDRLAREGVRFDRFFVENAICGPSRAAFLTGCFSARHGFRTNQQTFDGSQPSWPGILQERGYRTGVFGKWHLGFSYPYRPRDRGFDEVFVHGGGGVGQMEDYYGNSLFDTTFIHNGKVSPSKGYCTDVLFDRAMEYVEDKHKEKKPFFC